jgi:hypothetical protein
MAISRFKTSTLAQGLPKYTEIWDQSTIIDNGAFDSIQTVTLTSAQTTVTFPSIPSTYKHLQIRGFWRGNRATFPVSDALLRFNSDSGTNYASHSLTGQGNGDTTTGVQTGGAGSLTSINVGQPGTSVTGFVTSVIDILDYASTSKNKTVHSFSGLDINGTTSGYGGSVSLSTGVWLNSSTAINSISFTVGDGSQWQQYSSFALYGVK